MTGEEVSNLRERSGKIQGILEGEKMSGMLWGKSCLFTGSVYPHLWVRNAVI